LHYFENFLTPSTPMQRCARDDCGVARAIWRASQPTLGPINAIQGRPITTKVISFQPYK
jgi:hypothetical protein